MLSLLLTAGKAIAVKVLESVHEIIEEIEEEYMILRDHGRHPNLPSFFGIFMYKCLHSADQLWIAMEVSCVCFHFKTSVIAVRVGNGPVYRLGNVLMF